MAQYSPMGCGPSDEVTPVARTVVVRGGLPVGLTRAVADAEGLQDYRRAGEGALVLQPTHACLVLDPGTPTKSYRESIWLLPHGIAR